MKHPVLNSKHLLGIEPLTRKEIFSIFQLAGEFRKVLQRPIARIPQLQHITVANLFFENSTRTKLSFELAEKRLSAEVVNLSTGDSSISKGESLLDTIKNVRAMKVDMLVIRHQSSGVPHFISDQVDASVINAGDGTHEHPTQGLLDAYTILDKLGRIEDVKVLLLGDILHSRVSLSNIFTLKKLGAQVMVCGPPTLIPAHIKSLGVLVEFNLIKALQWCEVINVLRIQLERQKAKFLPSLREYALLYGIDDAVLDRVGKDFLILHPGPMNRGVEISSALADRNEEVILGQVENGMAIRMAVLYLIAGRRGETKR